MTKLHQKAGTVHGEILTGCSNVARLFPLTQTPNNGALTQSKFDNWVRKLRQDRQSALSSATQERQTRIIVTRQLKEITENDLVVVVII